MSTTTTATTTQSNELGYRDHEEYLIHNWISDVEVFFEWMNKVNKFSNDSYELTELRKHLSTKDDLNQLCTLFCDGFFGNINYIGACVRQFIRHKRRNVPFSDWFPDWLD